jgi:hypothetical protein
MERRVAECHYEVFAEQYDGVGVRKVSHEMKYSRTGFPQAGFSWLCGGMPV